ncbi:hypothetical protein [Roseomonas mucosa]|uniref:hypothetical protein n=1 Tax=Roseomonas mucosa TaxID=207340 RepID=UPI002247A225|nr:hypothetical protein [Roseomonas mucosa]UZO91809.1 Hypothetical protein RMP42_05968 [Roseomonas mucosa]
MTTTAIIPAGFIIHDDTAVFGCGATEGAAWADLRAYMDAAGSLPAEDAPEGANTYDEDDFKVRAATAALLAEIEAHGGALSWSRIDGVACTDDEARAARQD